MTIINVSEIRTVTGITDDQLVRIRDFLQGAVYCWCKARLQDNGGWFSIRDLMGGENNHWARTPLIELYNKHMRSGASNPDKQAGQDCGWILKSVLHDDLRTFEARQENLIAEYRWVPPA